jgi:hypothetical protein
LGWEFLLSVGNDDFVCGTIAYFLIFLMMFQI